MRTVSASRLKIRIGPHKFEAEGEPDTVMKQFELFHHAIAPESPSARAPAGSDAAAKVFAAPPLAKLFPVGARIVSLTVSPRPEDAVLMMLLGYKQFLKNESISGGEIMQGLRQSAIRLRRADAILTRHADHGMVVMSGRRRTLRYRLSAAVSSAQSTSRAA
jgi:hypothetical protein